jgi:hypothetical protein
MAMPVLKRTDFDKDDAPEGATNELVGTIVHFISLVKKPANRRSILTKSERAGQETWCITVPILKVDEVKKQIFGVVYAPDDTDTDGEFMRQEAIEAMAHDFVRANRSAKVDLEHDFVEGKHGFVAESWILRSEHPYFP